MSDHEDAPPAQPQVIHVGSNLPLPSALQLKVPLRRKFIGLFPPNSVAEYLVLFIFPQKTEQQTFHPNIV